MPMPWATGAGRAEIAGLILANAEETGEPSDDGNPQKSYSRQRRPEKMNQTIDYSEIDPNIRELVEVLNTFDGLSTVGSCGGHPNPTFGQWPENNWYVLCDITRNDTGWSILEFLTMLINSDMVEEVALLPQICQANRNSCELELCFLIAGDNQDPDQLAILIRNNKLDQDGGSNG